MSALADAEVGTYLNRHFVSAFQKVGTFRINHGQKQGGNVASYFCTPEGRVLHAIAGPVDAAAFLREARWANETFQLAQVRRPAPAELRASFRSAHLERLKLEHRLTLPEGRLAAPGAVSSKALDDFLIQTGQLRLSNEAKVHLVLAAGAMPQLDEVYQVVFERILNQKVTTQPVRIAGR